MEVAPKEDKTAAKKDKKPIAPVIIRREVTRIETVEEPKKVETKKEHRNDLGVVQRRTDTSMNIKYRTPPRKIGTITPQPEAAKEEIKKVEEPKISEVKKVVEQEDNMKEVKQEVKETKQEVKVNDEKVETVKPVAPVAEEKPRVVSNNQNDNAQRRFDNRNQNGDNRFQNRDGNRDNRDNRFQNRDGNRDNRDNRDNRFQNRDGNRDNRDNRFQNRDGNRDNRDNRDNRFQNRDGNRDNRDNKFNNRQTQTRESKVEKEIKGILANDTVSKEPVKEIVRTIYKDKEKDNRKFEESTKKSKGKGRNENRGEDIS